MNSSNPFARSRALMSAMAALMATGISAFAAATQSGADKYESRGKGRRNGRIVRTHAGNRSGRNYPFSSTKQDRKTATRQHTVVVNGFPLMQTRATGDRLSMSQVG